MPATNMAMSTGVVAVLSAVYGLVVGSFLNVVIARMPVGESVVKPVPAVVCCALSPAFGGYARNETRERAS